MEYPNGFPTHVPCVVGLDLDNTIVSYGNVLYRRALSWGWIPSGAPMCKRAIRDRVRLLPDGETKWQELQAYIYGPGMRDAELIGGVEAFIEACRERGASIYIVSHKTQFAAATPEGPDLRETALSWMKQCGLLDGRLGLTQRHVYFESTRTGKIERIRALGCTHFVDDLVETFSAPVFPADVVKLLYAPDDDSSASGDWLRFASWEAILEHFSRTCWYG